MVISDFAEGDRVIVKRPWNPHRHDNVNVGRIGTITAIGHYVNVTMDDGRKLNFGSFLKWFDHCEGPW